MGLSNLSRWEDLGDHPKHVSYFMTGSPGYEIPGQPNRLSAPLKGVPVVSMFLRNTAPEEAKTIVDARESLMNDHFAKSTMHPSVWVTLGYVYGMQLKAATSYKEIPHADGKTYGDRWQEVITWKPELDEHGNPYVGTTVYYQLAPGDYKYDIKVWDNVYEFPNRPEVYKAPNETWDPTAPFYDVSEHGAIQPPFNLP